MTQTMTKLEPERFEDGKMLMLAGLKEHYTPETIDDIPKQWERFGPFMGNVPTQVDDKITRLYFGRIFPISDLV